MKIFNVNIRVAATQIAEIPDSLPDPPEKKPFNDDPLDKQEKLMDKYLDRLTQISGPAGPMFTFGEAPDGASMTENVRITADGFDDLAVILKKFADVAKNLPAQVPKSLVAGGGAT